VERRCIESELWRVLAGMDRHIDLAFGDAKDLIKNVAHHISSWGAPTDVMRKTRQVQPNR
jgi:hypothetical protein